MTQERTNSLETNSSKMNVRENSYFYGNRMRFKSMNATGFRWITLKMFTMIKDPRRLTHSRWLFEFHLRGYHLSVDFRGEWDISIKRKDNWISPGMMISQPEEALLFIIDPINFPTSTGRKLELSTSEYNHALHYYTDAYLEAMNPLSRHFDPWRNWQARTPKDPSPKIIKKIPDFSMDPLTASSYRRTCDIASKRDRLNGCNASFLFDLMYFMKSRPKSWSCVIAWEKCINSVPSTWRNWLSEISSLLIQDTVNALNHNTKNWFLPLFSLNYLVKSVEMLRNTLDDKSAATLCMKLLNSMT